MRAYYFDNIPGDQRLEHDSGKPVDPDYLRKLGLFLKNIPLDTEDGWEPEINKIAEERGCQNRDNMDVTKEGLGDQFETMLDKYFTKWHMHDEEEIRYILSGYGFWDVREHPTDEWIRFQVLPGDFVIIPPGIYHRFTLGEFNHIKALRLTKEDPMYISYARGPKTDASASRARYLDSLRAAEVV